MNQTVQRYQIADYLNGITPAPAGKTLGWRYVARDMEDHPRTCGENC